MRNFFIPFFTFIVMFLTVGLIGCSKDPNPDPDPDPDPEPTTQTYHFDLWVALDRHGGMARDVQTLVRSMDNLDANQEKITFAGEGTEVNSVLSLETIQKGAYYYQVPVSGDRFSKYLLKDNQISVIAECRFQTNTYACRKYTHAWIDDNTLIIMAASGDAKSIIWTKLNATDMTILAEGTLDVPLPPNSNVFTTSGIHRDDLVLRIGGYPLRKYGSQGQQKSFLIALKLAQYAIVARNKHERPLLLLDDLFDKLDASRVERLIRLVANDDFGQILITDCNPTRLQTILDKTGGEYSLYTIENGEVLR